jgi:hypothetical protein
MLQRASMRAGAVPWRQLGVALRAGRSESSVRQNAAPLKLDRRANHFRFLLFLACLHTAGSELAPFLTAITRPRWLM